MKVRTKLNKIIDFLEEQEEVKKVTLTDYECIYMEKYMIMVEFKNGFIRMVTISQFTSVKDFKETYERNIKRNWEKVNAIHIQEKA